MQDRNKGSDDFMKELRERGGPELFEAVTKAREAEQKLCERMAALIDEHVHALPSYDGVHCKKKHAIAWMVALTAALSRSYAAAVVLLDETTERADTGQLVRTSIESIVRSLNNILEMRAQKEDGMADIVKAAAKAHAERQGDADAAA